MSYYRQQFDLLDMISGFGGILFGLYVLGMVFLSLFGYGDINAAIIKKAFKTSSGPPVSLSSIKLHGAKGEIAKRIPIRSVFFKLCRQNSSKVKVFEKAKSRLFKHLDVV